VFFPYFLVAAVMLRSLAARLALFHKLRRQIVVPEYSPPEVLTPAEAGLLVDNDFTFNEVAGTLKDLELRGCIGILEKGNEIEVWPLDLTKADDIERRFLQTLFGDKDYYSTGGNASASLLGAGKELARATRERLVQGGQLPKSRAVHKVVRGLFGLVASFAVLIQLVLTAAMLNPEKIFNIGYPRYPMHASEPLLEATMVLVVVAIVLNGFWQRSLADDNGLKNWRYVAGLKMFIEKVYKDRFYRDGKQMASDGDMRTFYPYALALGIEKRFTEKLKRALVL
jgi:hypothetical protein